MRKQRFIAWALSLILVLALAGCQNNEEKPDEGTEVSPTPVATEPTKEPEKVEVKPISVSFEDGSLSFTELYMQHAQSDAADVALGQFNNSTALKITKTNDAKVAFVAFDVASLLGDKAGDVTSFEMSVGVEHADGKFSAVSGSIYYWTDTTISKMKKDTWSVYMEKKNPRTATYKLPDGVTFGEGCPLVIVSLDGYNASKGGVPATGTIYVDDIRFFDASGNVITAATDVAFAAPDAFAPTESDRSNLYALKDVVTFDGFQASGSAWGQTGFDIPDNFRAALTEGSVIEIEYSSEDGSIWLVYPDSAAGWMRVADADLGAHVYRNKDKSIAQIDYEQMAAALGTDTSAWGARLQCEAASNWEVYSVKVGQRAKSYVFDEKAAFQDFNASAGAWNQAGADIPADVLEALVPGTALKISYSSEDGTMWIVMPDSAAGWMRVGQAGTADPAITDGSTCYVTYEQIAALCGEDKTTWGARLQCEAQSAWEVYSVKVGTFAESKAPRLSNIKTFPDFQVTGSGWGQNGLDIPDDIRAAFVPGAVIRIEYSSEDGTMWIVMPDSAAGWMRVAQAGTADPAICEGGVCYVTYEQIAALCGEDTSTWGGRLQCEAQTAWEVYGVSVGQTK
ncbi:MAG: hypothetical protein K6B75_04395 [Lachnospiraceae bacterium]|nr:hypothetical protein [Lachnospiraceae bacterium]